MMISQQYDLRTKEDGDTGNLVTASGTGDSGCEQQQEGSLALTVAALDRGSSEEADRIATMGLVDEGGNEDLWMAAGLARLARGRIRAARDAFRMCSWLSGDETARELGDLLSKVAEGYSETQLHSRR